MAGSPQMTFAFFVLFCCWCVLVFEFLSRGRGGGGGGGGKSTNWLENGTVTPYHAPITSFVLRSRHIGFCTFSKTAEMSPNGLKGNQDQ